MPGACSENLKWGSGASHPQTLPRDPDGGPGGESLVVTQQSSSAPSAVAVLGVDRWHRLCQWDVRGNILMTFWESFLTFKKGTRMRPALSSDWFLASGSRVEQATRSVFSFAGRNCCA